MSFHPRTVLGVDFSGAKLAGRTIWIATLDARPDRPRLTALDNLERLACTPDREPCLAHLVQMIRDSKHALWAIDAPFGLPVELLPPRAGYPYVLRTARRWSDGAHALGLHYLQIAKTLGGPNHLRRLTDAEGKAPFSCYHYRIAYQTLHVQRDVLHPLLTDPKTCVLPFQHERLSKAHRVLVEACPSSTLKLLSLPHHNYKQAEGGPLTPRRRRTRHVILSKLRTLLDLTDAQYRAMMRDPGGDAIDAVLASLGALWSWRSLDHKRIAADPRRRREGFIYAGDYSEYSKPRRGARARAQGNALGFPSREMKSPERAI